jgi:two-component system cell cycle sensor histidine kinase/response regulator CckA
VLGIVRAHHGAIQVESHPGRGTTFRLLLPLGDPAPIHALADPAAAPEPWAGGGTVLVADDEPGVLRMASRVLERAGFDVLTAADGREALECYPGRAADIVAVIVDMTMPGLGGVETFTALRELGAQIPIILSSGYSEREVRTGFPGGGPSDFLQKPYTAAALLEIMQRVLDPQAAGASRASPAKP